MSCNLRTNMEEHFEREGLIELVPGASDFSSKAPLYKIQNEANFMHHRLTTQYGDIENPIKVYKNGKVVFSRPIFEKLQKIEDKDEAKPTPAKPTASEEQLNMSVMAVAESLGLSTKFVSEIKDRTGNVIPGVAAADILNRSIQLVHGNGKKLSEEVVHFYVEALQEMNSPLYISMRDRVHLEPEFREVEASWANIEGYDKKALLNEAITQVILSNMDGDTRTNRNARWWRRTWDALKQLFNMSDNPYKIATHKMFTENLDEHREAIRNSQTSTIFRALSPREEVLERFKATNESMFQAPYEKDALKGKVSNLEILEDDKGIVIRYYRMVDGKKKVVTKRVTDESSIAFARSMGGIENAKAAGKGQKAVRARNAGTHLHGVGQDLIAMISRSALIKGVRYEDLHPELKPKNEKEIHKESGLKKPMFDNFKGEMIKLIQEASDFQKKEIDAKEDVMVLTEVKLYDRFTDTAGTADIVFLYSDGSMDIFDFKFISPKGKEGVKGIGQSRHVILDPFRGGKLESYDSQLSTYKRTSLENYAATKVRKTRIIPGHIDFTWTGDKLGEEITTFHMGASRNKFLANIPVGSELGNTDKLNQRLNKMYNSLSDLEKKHNTAPVRRQKTLLRASIKDMLLKTTYANMIGEIGDTIDAVAKRIDQRDPEKEGFMSLGELRHLMDVLSIFDKIDEVVAEDIAKLSTKAERDLASKKMEKATDDVRETMLSIHEEVKFRLTEAAGTKSKFDLSNLSMAPGWREMFNIMSDIDNPYFEEIYRRVMISMDNSHVKTEALREKWEDLDKKMKAWGNGDSRPAYDKLIREKNGLLRLIRVFNEEFSTEVDKRTQRTTNENEKNDNIAYMRSKFQIKKGAKEDYNEMLKRKRAKLLIEYPKKGDEHDAALARFKSMFDVWNTDSAWASPAYWRSLEVKPEIEKEVWSEEYEFINQKGNETLLEYYRAWKEQIKEFNGEMDEKYISPDLIPTVRSGLLEKIVRGEGSWSLTEDWLTRGFSLETELDDHSAGDPSLTVPLAHVNAIYDKRGNMNADLISKDLSKSMYMLGASVYNFVEKSEIEDEVLLLRYMMSKEGQEMTTQGGYFAKKKSGDAIIDDVSTDTLTRLDNFINYYLYNKSFSGTDDTVFGVSANKLVGMLNNIYSILKISVPVRIALATQVAGSIALRIEGVDGIHYKNEDVAKGMRMWKDDRKKYMAISHYLDIYQEGQQVHGVRNMRSSFLDRWLDQAILFEPLSMVDRSLDRRVGMAMMYTHGLDKSGNLKRLADLPDGTAPLIDTFSMKGDKLVGKLPQQARLDFRLRVKHITNGIKGDQSEEHILLAHLSIWGKIAGKFKWWLPGTGQARYGALRYSAPLDELKEGRFIGHWKAMSARDREAIDEEAGIVNFIGTVTTVLKNTLVEMVSLNNYAMTEERKALLIKKGKWEGSGQQKKYDMRMKALEYEIDDMKRKTQDPKLKNISKEQYVAMRQASVRRTIAELKWILGFILMSMVMGIKGDDDKEWYKKNYASRKFMDILAKIILETSFYLNPLEAMKMNKSAMPILGMVGDLQKLLGNTVQETARLIGVIGPDARDKSPMFYYSLTFVPGWNQLRSYAELFPQDKTGHR